jgi:hypothetical protein
MFKLKILLFAFLMSSFACFGQVVLIHTDTIISTEFRNLALFSSYGQEYDSPPFYIGGDSARTEFINSKRIYPECNRCKGSTVYSIITFTINEDGSLSNVVLKTGAQDCQKCDVEAIRIVMMMPKWNPAVFKGKNIKIKWDSYIPFTYLK